MNQRVGTCSICGGDVTGFRGAWMATIPPPPDECTSCGAVSATEVIQMAPRPRRFLGINTYPQTTTGTLDQGEVHRFWRGDGWRP